MIKRIFDFIFSCLGILILLPFFLIILVLIKIDSKGPAFYVQKRVGKDNKDFDLLKFRTMRPNSDQKGLLTVGKDTRITRIGHFLRKYKLDELPQLFNVLIGKMSFVGPRPEVRKYVREYSIEQLQVLSVRPGITDLASIRYSEENSLLAHQQNPEQFYINTILQDKLKLNLEYVRNNSLYMDVKIIFLTALKIWR